MKKVFMFCLALVMCLVITACNGHNSVGTDEDTAIPVFTDTGIRVKNHQNRVYSIVKDMNGFLYYCSDVEGTLAPVYSEYGLLTKDTDMFN